MKHVLVHGNPETPAVWDLMTPHLAHRDVVTPRLPGFGSPIPDGFGATQREYVDWLIAELEAIGEPVHLVGHDWGGGLVVPVACERPDLIASWATDVIGLFDPEYVWHDMAQVWQTPDIGEAAIGAMTGLSLAERTGVMEGLGIPPTIAADFAEALNPLMGDCVLALYRSAAQPAMANYAPMLANAAQRPGLVIAASDDPYVGGVAMAERAAVATGARVAVLDGLGHWWMLQDPARGAAVLDAFWSEPR